MATVGFLTERIRPLVLASCSTPSLSPCADGGAQYLQAMAHTPNSPGAGVGSGATDVSGILTQAVAMRLQRKSHPVAPSPILFPLRVHHFAVHGEVVKYVSRGRASRAEARVQHRGDP